MTIQKKKCSEISTTHKRMTYEKAYVGKTPGNTRAINICGRLELQHRRHIAPCRVSVSVYIMVCAIMLLP